MANKPKNGKELEAKIIAHAWKDPRYKERLLKNPHAAFKEMGLDIPNSIQIKVVEDKPNMFTFVLPSQSSKMQELSDAELEKIAAAAAYRTLGQKHNFTCEVGDIIPR